MTHNGPAHLRRCMRGCNKVMIHASAKLRLYGAPGVMGTEGPCAADIERSYSNIRLGISSWENVFSIPNMVEIPGLPSLAPALIRH